MPMLGEVTGPTWWGDLPLSNCCLNIDIYAHGHVLLSTRSREVSYLLGTAINAETHNYPKC